MSNDNKEFETDPEKVIGKFFDHLTRRAPLTPEGYQEIEELRKRINHMTEEQRMLFFEAMYCVNARPEDEKEVRRNLEDLSSEAQLLLENVDCTPRGALVASEILWTLRALNERNDLATLQIAREIAQQESPPASLEFFARRAICRSSDDPDEIVKILRDAETYPGEHLRLALRSQRHLPVKDLEHVTDMILNQKEGMLLPSAVHLFCTQAIYYELFNEDEEEKDDDEVDDLHNQLLDRLYEYLESCANAEKERSYVHSWLAEIALGNRECALALDHINIAIELCPEDVPKYAEIMADLYELKQEITDASEEYDPPDED